MIESGVPLLRIKNITVKLARSIKKDLMNLSVKKTHDELQKSQVKPLDIIIYKNRNIRE